jgi:hypothetical protein
MEGVFCLQLKRSSTFVSSTAKQFIHEAKGKMVLQDIYKNLSTVNCNLLSYGTKDLQVFLQMTTKGDSKVFFDILELASAH